MMKPFTKTTACLALGLFALLMLNTQTTYADEVAGAKKAAVCAGCHGAKGVSSNPQYPILAGQQSAYIVAQLKAFKSGGRVNPMMQHITSGLSDDDMENLGDFFASLPNDKVSSTKAGGEAKAKFAMCAGCHGSSAEGRGNFPKLSGQHPEYIVKRLQGFKTQANSPMNAMAKNLSDEDIKALADYLGSVK